MKMYEQPKAPQYQPGSAVSGYLRDLGLFLKGNSLDVWKAIKQLSERKIDLGGIEGGIEDLGSVITSLNDKVDSLTYESVGALAADGTAVNSQMLEGKTFEEMMNEIHMKIHPIGSLYISTSNTDPSTLFGGTWKQIKDTFLLAAGNNYVAGSTGGEATHLLTVEEMPSHAHEVLYSHNSGQSGGGYYYEYDSYGQWEDSDFIGTAAVGGGKAHNNMPPYIAVFVWERTA